MKEHLTSGLLDTLLHFVKWVDTWKKLLIVILMASTLAAGVVAWEYRSSLLEPVIRAAKAPAIDEDRLEPEMSTVMHDTDAVALAVWSVSMERNYRETIYVRINEQKVSRLEGVGDIVLRLHARETTEIIRLLDTSAACWPYTGATEIGMEAVRAGVKWVCATTIPPTYGHVAGILAVGFTGSPENEDFIKIRLINAAEKIMR
jgi:hypothetical protein